MLHAMINCWLPLASHIFPADPDIKKNMFFSSETPVNLFRPCGCNGGGILTGFEAEACAKGCHLDMGNIVGISWGYLDLVFRYL